MLTLTRADPHPNLGTALAFESGDVQRAVAWTSGAGPWDDFLPRMPDELFHFTHLATAGAGRFFMPRSEQYLDPARGADDRLQITIFRIPRLLYPHLSISMMKMRSCAIILRKHAYIHLSLASRHRYVPLPGLTAHEELADAAQLERDFPGIFEIE